MKKNILQVLLASGILTIVSLVGFYFIILTPKHEILREMLATQKQIAVLKDSLVQVRLNMFAMSKLNADSTSFIEDKNQTISKAIQSNNTAIQLTNEVTITDHLGDKDTKSKDYNQIVDEFEIEFTKHKQTLYQQQQILEQINDFNGVYKNIYVYDPAFDLQNDIINQNGSALLAKTDLAIQGLEDTNQQLFEHIQEFEPSQNVSDIVADIESTQEIFRSLRSSVTEENYTKAQAQINELISRFETHKKQGLDYQKDILKSPKSVSILTIQTNVIQNYEYFITEIDDALNRF